MSFVPERPIDKSTERFELKNDPPKPKRWVPPAPPKVRQKVLFTGLNCLPGQLDLFDTDGIWGED